VRHRALGAVLALGLVAPGAALAQWHAGAWAVPVVARADPVPRDSAMTQAVVAQPVVFAGGRLWGGRMRFHAMVNAEGALMGDGQLAPGVSGEGWFDKRHPHTWVHELIAALVDAPPLPRAGLRWSVAAGKGFAPFGSDDPMNRPALLFPANHHWAQVLERAVAVAAVRGRYGSLEAGLFNGDEPEKPDQWPAWDRFGDSWSVRGTVMPAAGIELSTSFARVESPEHRGGQGLDHTMWHTGARFARPVAGTRLYAMAEWAHTDEEGVFAFASLLAEAEVRRGRHRPYLRVERTDRPEETRLFGDPFRSVRPHHENGNIGITRWSIVTAGYGLSLGSAGPARAEAVVEAARARVAARTGILDPAGFYGRNTLWLLCVGVRIGVGQSLHRMGRYGAMEDDGTAGDGMHAH
jgi:hypothetical protein